MVASDEELVATKYTKTVSVASGARSRLNTISRPFFSYAVSDASPRVNAFLLRAESPDRGVSARPERGESTSPESTSPSCDSPELLM